MTPDEKTSLPPGGEEALREALFRRALGYPSVEEKETVEEDASGKKKIKTERTSKTLPPDLEAMRMLLSLGGEEARTIRVITEAPRPPEEEEA